MTPRTVAITLCLACASPASFQALAFKPEVHIRYTIRGANSCMPQVDPKDAMRLAMGTYNEDKTQLWKRITNWHYAPSPRIRERGVLIPLPLWGSRNLDAVFKERVEDIAAVKPGPSCRSEVFERVGRVLHFIQDMRVPGHVIPIHHGSILGEEGFDGYVHDPGTQGGIECGGIDVKGAMENPLAAFARRRDDAAQETRDRLKEPFGETGCAAKDIFWCDPADGKRCRWWPFDGFGAYARKERNGEEVEVTFGTSPVWCKGQWVDVTEKDYASFLDKGYKGLMLDTVFAARFAESFAHKRCGEPQ